MGMQKALVAFAASALTLIATFGIALDQATQDMVTGIAATLAPVLVYFIANK